MKFSIPDLLLVTVIVALAVGWWLDHWRQAAEIYRLNNQWESYPPTTVLKELLKSQAPAPNQPKP